MKLENLMYWIGSMIVIVAAVLKILHLPGAGIAWSLSYFSILGMYFFVSHQNTQLRKKVKELEDQINSEKQISN